VLQQRESVWLDAERLEALYLQLGETHAENVVCRALEQIAARLAEAQRCYCEARLDQMRKSSRSLIAIADQIGMALLARVAGDVTQCIDSGDQTALSATFARLLRLAEVSLCEIWMSEDRPV